jgi:hypothetical protein
VRELIPQFASASPNAVIVNITNPVDALPRTSLWKREKYVDLRMIKPRVCGRQAFVADLKRAVTP